MEYNTSRDQLIFREYGRNVQKIIQYAVTIEDAEKKTQIVDAIIRLMGQMHPHLRNIEDFRHKLWDHLFIMSDFKLDVESPYPTPTKETVKLEKVTVPYPSNKIKFRHYGKNVENLIEKAVGMEDPDQQKAFAKVIAHYMKMVYASWNRDGANDDHIKADLKRMSGDVLDLGADAIIEVGRKSYSNRSSSRDNGRYNNNRGRGGRNDSRGGRDRDNRDGGGYKRKSYSNSRSNSRNDRSTSSRRNNNSGGGRNYRNNGR